MAETRAKIRLFVDAPLDEGLPAPLGREQSHYIVNVMRLSRGESVAVFNGRDGEWRAELAEADRRAARLVLRERLRPQADPPDLWLLFCPLRKARTDFLVEKAVELGARRLLPVLSERTVAERVNAARLRAHAVEAAEQCGALAVPEVLPPAPLAARLADWPAGRALLFCDETGAGAPLARAAPPPPAAILVGPEGGFAPGEAAALRARPGVIPVALGPRILRAETAAVAALALWQAAAGDWR